MKITRICGDDNGRIRDTVALKRFLRWFLCFDIIREENGKSTFWLLPDPIHRPKSTKLHLKFILGILFQFILTIKYNSPQYNRNTRSKNFVVQTCSRNPLEDYFQHHRSSTNLIHTHLSKILQKKKTFSNIFSKNFFSAKIRENETTFRLKLTTSYQENSLSRGEGAIDIL